MICGQITLLLSDHELGQYNIIVCTNVIAVLIYIDRTALFIIRIYFIYYHSYYYFFLCVCVVQYMCLSCSIDHVSICGNKEIFNK